MFTTVPSSIAMPEPSTAAATTHRPWGVPRASSASVIARSWLGHGWVMLRSRDAPGVAQLRRVRRPRRRATVVGGLPAEVLVEPPGPVVLLEAPQLRDRRTLPRHGGERQLDRCRGQPGAP